MIRSGRFLLSIAMIACIVGAAAPALAATEGKPNTVGTFLVSIANLKKLPAEDAVMAEAALRSAGYDLPRLSHGKSLTEGDVAAISSSLGLRVASSNPTRGFSTSQSDQFLMTVRADLQSAGMSRFSTPRPRDENSWSNGKGGGKKPRSKSPKKPCKPPRR